MKLKIERMLHAAVLVSDLDRARKFYEGFLGLKPKPRPTMRSAGAWYDLGDCELHLMATEAVLPPAEKRPQSDFHIAFMIDDYDAVKCAIEEAGLPYRESRSGLKQLFIRDPDGNLIELNKPMNS